MLEEDDDEFERDGMGFYNQTVEERIASTFKNCGWVPDKVTHTSTAPVKLSTAAATVPAVMKTPAQAMVKTIAKEVVRVLANTPAPVKTPAKTLNASRNLIRRLREWDSETLTECQQNELWKGAVHHALKHLLSASVLCPRGQHSLMRFQDYMRTYRGVYGSCQEHWMRLKEL